MKVSFVSQKIWVWAGTDPYIIPGAKSQLVNNQALKAQHCPLAPQKKELRRERVHRAD